MLALAGCGGDVRPPAGAAASTKEASFTFVLSGDTAGFIVPCGCASKQFGGLPRRATYLNESAARNRVYLDAGGSVHRATAYDAIKLEYIWKGVQSMKPVALNLGAGEVQLGAERLAALAAAGVPLLSSNVRSKGKAAWSPSLETTIDGVRIAFVGVCVAPPRIGEGLEVADAEASLKALVPKLAKDHDAVVLLAYADESACIGLMEKFPELSVVLAAGTNQPVPPRLVENRTLFAATAQKGKFLARLDIAGKKDAWRLDAGSIVELAETIKDDDQQVANLASYKQRLKHEKLDPSVTGEAPALLRTLPGDFRYAGSQSCAECHVQDAKLWGASKHAHGLETLTAKNFDFDPYCLKCHTTGYGAPGGFKTIDVSAPLGGIGCESCHGPAHSHVVNPRTKTIVDARTACITCHDPENSPNFVYGEYWPKIKHGEEKATKWKSEK